MGKRWKDRPGTENNSEAIITIQKQERLISLIRGGTLSLELFGGIRLYCRGIYEQGNANRSPKKKDARFKRIKLSLNRKFRHSINIERFIINPLPLIF